MPDIDPQEVNRVINEAMAGHVPSLGHNHIGSPDPYTNPSDALEALEWWGRSSDDARYFELEWCESGCVATLGVVDEQDDDGSCRTIISCEYGDTYSAAIALAIYDAINTPHP